MMLLAGWLPPSPRPRAPAPRSRADAPSTLRTAARTPALCAVDALTRRPHPRLGPRLPPGPRSAGHRLPLRPRGAAHGGARRMCRVASSAPLAADSRLRLGQDGACRAHTKKGHGRAAQRACISIPARRQVRRDFAFSCVRRELPQGAGVVCYCLRSHHRSAGSHGFSRLARAA